MSVWAVLALCAIGATSRSPFFVASSYIPFSEGRDRIFSTSAELIKSLLGETPRNPHLPAVIPSNSRLPVLIPSQQLGIPEENQQFKVPEENQQVKVPEENQHLKDPEEFDYDYEEPIDDYEDQTTDLQPDGITILKELPSRPGGEKQKTQGGGELESRMSNSGSNIAEEEEEKYAEKDEEKEDDKEEKEDAEEPGTPASVTEPASPPRPVFTRSMHLRDELTVSGSDYTEVYDIEYHADSRTSRTTIGNTSTIYRGPAADGRIQYLRIKADALSGKPVRRCTKSPPLSATDSGFPGLPNLEPYQFAGYKTEEGRQVEHWQHIIVGRPGDYGAVRGEVLNYTHDFFVYRDGEDAVPLRYTATTDSTFLGPASDTYTHSYQLLPAPTEPLVPDVIKLCDEVKDYKAKLRRRRATLSKEEFIWLINAKKPLVLESRSNDLTEKEEETVWLA